MRLMCAVVAMIALCSCTKKEDDEAIIRKVLEDAVAALEARDANAAVAPVAEKYRDSKGRTRDKLKGLAFFALQQGPVLVKLGNVAVEIKGETAVARVNALAVQGSGELKSARDLLPTNARAFDLDIFFTHSGKWEITAIEGLGGGGMD